jgi:nitrate reductase delta subunit
VATFDLNRRHALHLTYFTHGDTRKRGLALLRIKQTYRRFGYVLDDTELPDHLSVVLEFAATVDADGGTRLLQEHRAGLELLGLALAEAGSPYAAATAAVSATLPPLHGSVHEAVARLAAEGPPGEEVGLDPFVPPEVSGARR